MAPASLEIGLWEQSMKATATELQEQAINTAVATLAKIVFEHLRDSKGAVSGHDVKNIVGELPQIAPSLLLAKGKAK
jgi:hypothetical protein